MTHRSDRPVGDPGVLYEIGFVEKFEPGQASEHEKQDRHAYIDRTAPPAKPTRNPKGQVRGITAADLQTKKFPPVKYVIPGYVTEGLTILAGKPKLGKSWCCLDWACAVAAGGFAFGSVACERGDVLYLALEDNKRRLRSRLEMVLRDGSWPGNLTFWTECRRLNQGGLDNIERWLTDHDQARLVIIDVFARVRPGGKSEDARYDADYRALEGLHGIAHKYGIAIVVVHHTRKMDADDPIDTVSGTLGFTGAADSILVLKRDGQGVTLYGRGRDIEEIETAVRFDKALCRWTILGEAAEVHRSDQRRQIIDALDDADEPVGPLEIANVTGMRPVNVRQLLWKMARSGEVATVRKGKYATPDNSDNTDNTDA